MDSTHLHLLLNHFPILGTFFGLCLLAYGFLRKNMTLEKAGLITLIIITLLTIPAFLTGDKSEDAVENLPGISEYYLEQHEELAEVALWLMVATGVLAITTLIVTAGKNKRGILIKSITLLLAAGSLVVMLVVGNYGGKIRHSEIRGQAINQVETGPGEARYQENDD